MSIQEFTLIPLTIEARGEVISSNIDEFRDMVRQALGVINRSPASDEEFGQAELDVKALKGAEDAVTTAKEKALRDAESLHALFSVMDETSTEIRTARLELEKQIEKRKTEVRSEMIAQAMARLDCAHRLKTPVFGKSVAESIKGKRTLESMQKALDVIVTIHNGTIAKNRKAIKQFVAEHGETLVMDRDELETKSPDSVEAELRRRIEAKQAQETKKRLEEQAAKAEAEAAKAKADLAMANAPAAPAAPVDPRNPHNLPPPPKIGTIPVGRAASAANVIAFPTNAGTADLEWEAFRTAVLTSFGPLKVAKAALTHPSNIARANAFAQAVNTAWNAMKEEVAL